MQDIGKELQEKEMEAWQNLIRVLTHEIMNSMTPITSLSATIIDMLAGISVSPDTGLKVNPDTGSVKPDTGLADIKSALKTIHKRSIGLSRFVSAYRKLNSKSYQSVNYFSG